MIRPGYLGLIALACRSPLPKNHFVLDCDSTLPVIRTLAGRNVMRLEVPSVDRVINCRRQLSDEPPVRFLRCLLYMPRWIVLFALLQMAPLWLPGATPQLNIPSKTLMEVRVEAGPKHGRSGMGRLNTFPRSSWPPRVTSAGSATAAGCARSTPKRVWSLADGIFQVDRSPHRGGQKHPNPARRLKREARSLHSDVTSDPKSDKVIDYCRAATWFWIGSIP